jgi:phosphatidylinositol 4-phosphatase
MLWFTFASLSLLFILIHGIDYVSWPRLIPPTDVIYYNGPGFRSGNNGKGLGSSAESPDYKASAKWLSTGRKRTASRVEEIELGTKKRVD